jgi:general secretion pathway protein G
MQVKPGFSIIEVVIAIAIGLLMMGVVAPKLWQYLSESRVSTTQMTLKNVQTALDAYNADVQEYPQTLDELVTAPEDEKVRALWKGPYLQKMPVDGWKRELMYQPNTRGAMPPYELYSWGAAGEGSAEEEFIHARNV